MRWISWSFPLVLTVVLIEAISVPMEVFELLQFFACMHFLGKIALYFHWKRYGRSRPSPFPRDWSHRTNQLILLAYYLHQTKIGHLNRRFCGLFSC
ncbi:hypothetical protein ACI2JN_10310 [Ochrobactrum teleogrylli]|uniref:hypothetical protein n=1 Tax=Ochrobactrum teleogrylli TaxID=2479765 RepID=UPI00384B6C65